MSTRKLIAIALVAGLAILLAGGVFLFNVARNRDQLTVSGIRAVGEVVEVGPVRAGVLAARVEGDVLVLDVQVDATQAASGLSDVASAWTVVIGRQRDRLDVPPGTAGTPCRGLGVAPGGSVDCSLAFAAADGPAYAAFSLGGEQEQWRLDG